MQLSRETPLQCCYTLIYQCWGQAMQENRRLVTFSQEDFLRSKAHSL